MTKKSKKKNNFENAFLNEYKKKNTLPFVSVCTPTYNRRPFIDYMIKCFLNQDYPKENIEWIIIDDGTDKIEDLVKDIPQVKYYKYDEKMPLGKKRNIMHDKCKGDIIVYMDDDDYYPSMRISHAVEILLKNPSALCAGSSEIYIYFKHINKLYQFGPYSPNHATAGTFAFKKELLLNNKYDDTACLAEEKHFLKNYTVPFVQLDPLKTILVFSHNQNTFDKKHLLVDNHDERFCKESDKTVDMFVKEKDFKDFYMNKIGGLLINYEPGKPEMKPDVLTQMLNIERERRRYSENLVKNFSGTISITTNNGEQHPLTNEQIVGLLKKQQANINQLVMTLKLKDEELNKIKNDNTSICAVTDLTENSDTTNTQVINQASLINELEATIKLKDEELNKIKNDNTSICAVTDLTENSDTTNTQVIKQASLINELEATIKLKDEEIDKIKNNELKISIVNNDGKEIILDNEQIISLIKNREKNINKLATIIDNLKIKYNKIKKENNRLNKVLLIEYEKKLNIKVSDSDVDSDIDTF